MTRSDDVVGLGRRPQIARGWNRTQDALFAFVEAATLAGFDVTILATDQ